MGLGEAAGYNYAIPQNFIGQQNQVPQPPAGDFGDSDIAGPKQGDYLAHVENLSDKYYETAGLLRSFAHDQSKKGIDVTQPDYSQPGGGELFKTWQKLNAVLMHTANDLANSNDIDKTMEKLYAEGKIRYKQGFDPRKQASATMNPQDMYYSTELTPGQEESNIRGRDRTYTQADSNKLNSVTYDAQIAAIDDAVRNGQLDPQIAAYQKAQLVKNASTTSYQQLIPHNGRGGSKVPPGVSVLKKVVNLSSGVWADGSYKPVVSGSKTYLENKEMAGESLGQYMSIDKKGAVSYKPKVISRWLKDPDTGEVRIQYQDPEVPDDVVSSSPGSTATNFIANNPKYGDVAKTMDVANSLGILDDAGNVDATHPDITPANAEQIKAKVRETGKAKASAVSARVARDLKQLKELKTGFLGIGNDKVSYKLPSGIKAEVKTLGDGKFEITNAGDIGLSDEDASNLSAEEVLDTLGDLGLFDNTKDSDSQPNTRQLSAIDAFTKQKGRTPSENERAQIMAKYK